MGQRDGDGLELKPRREVLLALHDGVVPGIPDVTHLFERGLQILKKANAIVGFNAEEH